MTPVVCTRIIFLKVCILIGNLCTKTLVIRICIQQQAPVENLIILMSFTCAKIMKEIAQEVVVRLFLEAQCTSVVKKDSEFIE